MLPNETKLYIRQKFEEFRYHRDREMVVNFPEPTIIDLDFDVLVETEDNYGRDITYKQQERMQIDVRYITRVDVSGSRFGRLVINCDNTCITMKNGVRRDRVLIDYTISSKLEADRIARAPTHLAEMARSKAH